MQNKLAHMSGCALGVYQFEGITAACLCLPSAWTKAGVPAHLEFVQIPDCFRSKGIA
jgi:hypothetical protein